MIWVVHVISMEFLRSLLGRRFAGARVATSRNVGCFLRLKATLVLRTSVCSQIINDVLVTCFIIYTYS